MLLHKAPVSTVSQLRVRGMDGEHLVYRRPDRFHQMNGGDEVSWEPDGMPLVVVTWSLIENRKIEIRAVL